MIKDNDSMNEDTYPKVLVFSHNCFSNSGSNGRTLGNFFVGWPKDSLAQFYIYNEIPDSSVCEKYFRVTDIEVLKAFYKGERVGEVVERHNIIKNQDGKMLKNIYLKHRKKTPINYLVRNLIWNSGRWKSEEFKKWVDDFNPDVILWQVGDYEFMIEIVLKIAVERNIPVFLYNSEDYYFKDKKSISLLRFLYRFQYKRKFEKLIKYTSYTVYICDMLQETYNKRFIHKSSVLMTSTSIVPLLDKKENEAFITSYLGNLGLGRHESLIDIANSLQKIDQRFKLDVYGKIPNETVEVELKRCSGIRYMGLIPYQEVISVMQQSDLLVHAENFSDYSRWNLKHAFSTKISDSLASGTCLLVYAPENLAFVKYLSDTKSAYTVTDKNDLVESLNTLINDRELRKKYINTALKVVGARHNIFDNANKFKNLILDTLRK